MYIQGTLDPIYCLLTDILSSLLLSIFYHHPPFPLERPNLLDLIFINNELNQNDSFLYTAEQSEAKHEAKVGGIKIII